MNNESMQKAMKAGPKTKMVDYASGKFALVRG
jgi:hypothetical protein